jgi:ABC-type Zn uptake system ZnuABC Zn-binding protein ZnuA
MTHNVVEGIPGLAVHSLLPPNVGCPHNYSMTPADAALLEEADVLVMNGLGMETFLEGSPYVNRAGLHLVNASEMIDPIPIEASGAEEPHGDLEDVHQLNPHAWVSPFEAARMTLQIGNRLAEIDPEYAEKYARNAAIYAARLDTLGRILVELVSKGSNRKIVTFHNAYNYLARDLRLDIVAVIQPESGVEPSARRLVELIEIIQKEKPAAIFSEPQYSDRLARMLSQETGVPLYTLDPAVTGPDDPMSYYNAMVQNLRVLQRVMERKPPEE